MGEKDDPGKTDVDVKLFGAMRDLVGRAELRLALPSGATLAALISRLEQQHPALMERLLPGIQDGYIAIVVDGRHVTTLAGLETPLSDGCTISFLPPFAGG